MFYRTPLLHTAIASVRLRRRRGWRKCVSFSRRRRNNWNSAKFSTRNPILSKTNERRQGVAQFLLVRFFFFSFILFYYPRPIGIHIYTHILCIHTYYIIRTPGEMGSSRFLLVNFIRWYARAAVLSAHVTRRIYMQSTHRQRRTIRASLTVIYIYTYLYVYCTYMRILTMHTRGRCLVALIWHSFSISRARETRIMYCNETTGSYDRTWITHWYMYTGMRNVIKRESLRLRIILYVKYTCIQYHTL